MDQFNILKTYLHENLLQEWLVSESMQTTCRGPVNFIRIDRPKSIPIEKDQPLCLIQIKNGKIEVTSSNILDWRVHFIIRRIKEAIAKKVINDCCINLTECDLTCTACHEVWELFH